MAGTQTPTTFTNAPQMGVGIPPPPYRPNVYPPGNVCPIYPPSASSQLPQFRQNLPNHTSTQSSWTPQCSLGATPCSSVNQCLPTMPYSQGVPQQNVKCLPHTYPVSYPYSGSQMPCSGMGQLLPNPQHPQQINVSKGESEWTNLSQFFTPQPASKRTAEEINALGNPPSKRLRQDQSGQPYSVQVNGYQKGMHIQGSCYLTVRQDSTQQQHVAEVGCSSEDKSRTLPQPGQGHLDVSVTPVLPKPPPQNDPSAVTPQLAMRVIMALVSLACKHVPPWKKYFARLKTEHNVLCLPKNACWALHKLLKIPKDIDLLTFFDKHRRMLCMLANQGRCPDCANDKTVPCQNESKHQNGSGKDIYGSNMSKPAGTHQWDKAQPLAALQSAALNAGNNVMNQSTQNNENLHNYPYPTNSEMSTNSQSVTPYVLNDTTDSPSPNISSTFLSESEFRERPYNDVSNISDTCHGDIVSPQVTGLSHQLQVPQAVAPLPGANSVQMKQNASGHLITNSGHQSGGVNSFPARSPTVSQNGPWMTRNVSSCAPYPVVNTSPLNQLHNTQGVRFGTSNSTLCNSASSSFRKGSVSNPTVVSHTGQGGTRFREIRPRFNNLGVSNMGQLWTASANPIRPVLSVGNDNQQFSMHRMDRSQTNNQSAYSAACDVSGNGSTQSRGIAWCPPGQAQLKMHSGNLLRSPNTKSPICQTGQPSSPFANNRPQTQGPVFRPALPESNRSGAGQNFRQQAASLMKLPESISDEKPPRTFSHPTSNSSLPTSDVMNCFSLKPSIEHKPPALASESSNMSNKSSSGMILPLLNAECIYIEDSDDEEPPTANSGEALTNVSSPNSTTVNADSTDINRAKRVMVNTADSIISNSFHSSSENDQGSTHSDVCGDLPKEGDRSSNIPRTDEKSKGPVLPSEDTSIKPKTESSAGTNEFRCGKDSIAEKNDNVPLEEALKELDGTESLESLMARGEAAFATFVFDVGTGEMEITTAEFGEEEWEQLMKG